VIRGTNRETPLNSLQTLLEHLPVSGGDRIYIDTGVYPVSATNAIILDDRNMGSEAFPLEIIGSTNWAAGGTWFQVDGTTNGMRIQNTRHIHLKNIRVSGARNGLSVESVDTLRIQDGEFFGNQANGIQVGGSSGVEVRNSLIWGNGEYGVQSRGAKGAQSLRNVTLWGNRLGAVENAQSTLMISNSILVATNPVAVVRESGDGTIFGDYNLYWNEAGGPIATNAKNQVAYLNLSAWQQAGRDVHSLVEDPLFADPAAAQFHLQSREGYWDNGSWPTSSLTSWAIDAGDPDAAGAASEPAPNGSRLNLGAYGGTSQASLSQIEPPELLAVSLRDGGIALEQQRLYWLFRGLSSSNTVSLWYSPDNRESWVLLDSGHPIGSGFDWISLADPTPEAWWKVALDANTNIYDEVGPFTHRTRALTYYVNDDDRAGDVYTGAIGDPGNLGYVSNSPLHSIQAVLDRSNWPRATRSRWIQEPMS
jgi:hypothetical protein